MKSKVAIILIGIILIAYFIFNTILAFNWVKSKVKPGNDTEKVGEVPVKRIPLSVDPIYEIEERGDTLLVLKEGCYEIKEYIELKNK